MTQTRDGQRQRPSPSGLLGSPAPGALRRAALLLSLLASLVALGSAGCQSDKPPGSGKEMKDPMPGSDPGGVIAGCEDRKCSSPDAKCCPGEPCADLNTHPLHCGGCGKACRPLEVCSTGKCACRGGGHDDICEPDAACCSDGCRNLKSDPKNCGACGFVCNPGETCIDSQCRCGPAGLACRANQVCCASGCSDLKSDPRNCNKCDRACPMGKSCKDGLCEGECAMTCTFPKACCSGMCADLANDPNNCGACGHECNKIFGFAICKAGICFTGQPDGGAAADMSGP